MDKFEDVNKDSSEDKLISDLDNGEDQFEDYLSRRASGDTDVEPEVGEENGGEKDDPEAPIIIDDEIVNESRYLDDSVKGIKEKRTVLEGREAPIIGKYIVERTVDAPEYPGMAEIFNNTYHLAVTEMTVPQIRKIQEENEEFIAKRRFVNYALRKGEETLLLRMSPEEAETYRKRREWNDKNKSERKTGPKAAKGSSKTKAGVTRARSSQEKYAKANQDMGLTKAENIDDLKSLGPKFWNNETMSFIDTLYTD